MIFKQLPGALVSFSGSHHSMGYCLCSYCNRTIIWVIVEDGDGVTCFWDTVTVAVVCVWSAWRFSADVRSMLDQPLRLNT